MNRGRPHLPIQTSKICCQCGEEKDADAFHKRGHRLDSYCKECRKLIHRNVWQRIKGDAILHRKYTVQKNARYSAKMEMGQPRYYVSLEERINAILKLI